MSDSEDSTSLETDAAGTDAVRTTLQASDGDGKHPECYILHTVLCKMIYNEPFSSDFKSSF